MLEWSGAVSARRRTVENLGTSPRGRLILGTVPASAPLSPADPGGRLAELARAQAQALAAMVPLVGHHRLQVAVDGFVDEAIGALSTLAAAGDTHAGRGHDGPLRRGIPDRRPSW